MCFYSLRIPNNLCPPSLHRRGMRHGIQWYLAHSPYSIKTRFFIFLSLSISLFFPSSLILPLTPLDCENPLRVNNEDFPGYCRLSEEDSYLSARNRSDCEECGGEPEPPATWTKPTWRGGQAVQAQWRKVEMVPPYQYVSDSISFLRLQTLFDIAANNYENFILWVSFYIFPSPLSLYLLIFPSNILDWRIVLDQPFLELFRHSGL